MNRRDLFKWTAAAGSALLLPALIPKPVTYFLAPYGGWGAQRLKIRKIQQYLVNRDSEPWRYDACWVTSTGEHVQFHVDMGGLEDDGLATHLLLDRMEIDGGTPNSDHFKLELPRQGLYGQGSYFYADQLHRMRV
jgi:hypothetical protein